MDGNYVYSLKSAKYGTPTGTNTMPASGDLTALPNTVRDSVSISESDPTQQEFYVDQKQSPIRIADVEGGLLSLVMQFYDMDYSVLEAIKGGTATAGQSGTVAAKWANGATFSAINKALQVETDSGHFINLYNAKINAKITGSGSRSGMFAVEMTAVAQLAADASGDYEISDINPPA